ncbi:MAG: hypothetical protein ACLR2O_04250 [Coprococcus sp.]
MDAPLWISSSISPVRNHRFTGLVSKRYNIRCHGCQMFDMCRRIEVRALLQNALLAGLAEPFQSLDTEMYPCGRLISSCRDAAALKFCVVEAVEQEVQSDQEQQLLHLPAPDRSTRSVVGSRKEFHKDLADNTDTWFLIISY